MNVIFVPLRTLFRIVPCLAGAGLFPLFAAAPVDDGPVWTDHARAEQEDPDFSLQGEYVGATANKQNWGLQVVAQGAGRFEAYLLRHGLPGQGWTPGQPRTVLFGRRYAPEVAVFHSADNRIEAVIRGSEVLVTQAGAPFATLKRIERVSPTLGAQPPEGAIVLFDGTDARHWTKGTVTNGLLGSTDTLSVPRFRDFTLHLEFLTPYKPFARAQRRGNSGVYFGGRWETQILDSFGLTGEMNECGGIYSIARPEVNACLPPLTWQTYDVEFTGPRFDGSGKVKAWPRITVRLNGVVIHDDQVLAKTHTTAAPIQGELTNEPMPIFLQNHDNPVFFRNIWVLEKR